MVTQSPDTTRIDPIAADALMQHVRALASDIGPRPAGSPAEDRAREYVKQVLEYAGISYGRDLPFDTPDSWGPALIASVGTAALGNLLGGRGGRLLGAAASAGVLYALWRMFSAQPNPIAAVVPTKDSATLVVRIPSAGGEAKRKIVLVGHTDTNKHRMTFAPERKSYLVPMGTLGLVTLGVNAALQLLEALGIKNFRWLRTLTFGGILGTLGILLADEAAGYIDGANDNASAVACVLGLGLHLNENRLKNTEVWLAFTGAEETGCLGMHALLDAYEHELQDAYFVDFEMVGAGDIVYVTEHTGFSAFNTYTPDDESLALALETARAHPELGVRGAPMTILEEIGALRGRGFRGICIAGQGRDGCLMNWHQYSDNAANIDPACLEKAARFALGYLHTLDSK